MSVFNFFKINSGIHLTPQSSAPASPLQGDCYFDNTLKMFRVFDGTQWDNLNGNYFSPTTSTDSTSGTGATLAAVVSGIVELTSGSLVSFEMIPAPSSGIEFILINRTGASVTVINDTGGTAANQITTGTGSNITLGNRASLFLTYSANEARWMVVGGSGGGGVSSVSVTSANGFAGTVANPTTTPAITVSTSVTGVLKGNGTAISAATSGTDYTGGTVTGPIGISSNTSTVTAQTGTGSTFVMNTSPTLVTPNLGTPSAAVLTNATGTATALNIGGNAGNITATSNSTLTTLSSLALPYSQLTGTVPTYSRYVDFSAGNDSTGNGSQALPWKTLSHTFTAITGIASPSTPVTIYLSGGNDSTDTTPLYPPANINVISQYPITIPANITVGGSGNDQISFTNIIFNGDFTWDRDDTTALTANFTNVTFNTTSNFIEQNNATTGSLMVNMFNCVVPYGSGLSIAGGPSSNTAVSYFNDCVFAGGIEFQATPNSIGNASLQFSGGTLTGGGIQMGSGSTCYFYFNGVNSLGLNDISNFGFEVIYTDASSINALDFSTPPFAINYLASASNITGLPIFTTTPAIGSVPKWDSNKNLSANNFIEGYATTATAAGTTTLVVGSAYAQYFTGTSTQTVKLPNTSTLVLGQQFLIENRSTGAVTVLPSGAGTIQVMASNTQLLVTCILITGTTAASWDAVYTTIQPATGGGGASLGLAMAIAQGNYIP